MRFLTSFLVKKKFVFSYLVSLKWVERKRKSIKASHLNLTPRKHPCRFLSHIRSTRALYNFGSSWRIKNEENQVILRCLLRCFPLPPHSARPPAANKVWRRAHLQRHLSFASLWGWKRWKMIILSKQLFLLLFIIHQFRHVNNFLRFCLLTEGSGWIFHLSAFFTLMRRAILDTEIRIPLIQTEMKLRKNVKWVFSCLIRSRGKKERQKKEEIS